MQNHNMIRPEVGKLSKAAVDKIPLVLYIPAPPGEYEPEKNDVQHSYPPKKGADEKPRKLKFKVICGIPIFYVFMDTFMIRFFFFPSQI